MNEYRGKHAPSQPWPVSSTTIVRSRKGRHRKKNHHRRARIIILLVLVIFLVSWPFVEAKLLTTDKVLLSMADLPSDANHLRIVYLSDIHWGFWYTDSELSGLLTRINDLRPDLVIFGGDYATDHTSAVQFFERLQSMSKIRARYGVFGVLGETDCGETAFDRTQLSESMTNAGIIPLVNQVTPVNIGSSRIYIAGLDDSLSGSPNLKSVSGSVSASDFVIFVAHNPSVIPNAQKATDSSGALGWFDLGLFGHTHGGQMMFFSDLLAIADDVPERYRSGWLTENRETLLISRGVGTSALPCRLFCFPQIHFIELIAE